MDPAAQTPPISPLNSPVPDRSKMTLLVLGGIGAFVILLLGLFLLQKHQSQKTVSTGAGSNSTSPTKYPSQNGSDAAKKNAVASIKPLPFVYGSWFTNQSRIYLVDPESQKNTLLTTLPFTVKKVHPLSLSKIIYINNTDTNDQGTDISIWDTAKQITSRVLQADTGFRIDTYAISPNGKYLVDWELQLNPQTNAVKGGRSRVYTVDMSHPLSKTLLFDENASGTAIHYPVLITNAKDVYLDNYLPNSGVGYGYGMTESSFDGTQKNDVTAMQNGSYSTQPEITSDGKYLLFTGYDGSKGKGSDLDKGVRIASLYPTSVDVYDIATKKRRTLAKLPQKHLFYNVIPSVSDPDLVFFQLAATSNTLAHAVYRYSLKHQIAERLPYPSSITNNPSVVAVLSPTVILIGSVTPDKSVIGNLGMQYTKPFTTLAAWDTATNSVSPVSLRDVSLAQYIDTLTPESSKVLADEISPPDLILKTFPFVTITPTPLPTATPVPQPTTLPPPVTKPDLEDMRSNQQTTPRDNESDREVTRPSVPEDNRAGCLGCDHPLYLYGPQGMEVNIKIGTQIFHTIPASTGQYHATLSGMGKFLVNERLYDSISYSFVPHITPQKPAYGSVVTTNNVSQTLSWYAQNLGLNQKETADLLTYAKEKLFAQFTFISYFDEGTSEQIIPVSFDPHPDYYQNVIFYFRDLSAPPLLQPLLPQFTTRHPRSGFTAIDIGEYHE